MQDPKNNETPIRDFPEEPEIHEPDEFENDDAEYEESLTPDFGFANTGTMEG